METVQMELHHQKITTQHAVFSPPYFYVSAIIIIIFVKGINYNNAIKHNNIF